MDRQEAISINLYECMEAEGFLVRLRGREFSHEHYDRLMQALRAYREMIRGKEWMERKVATCLYYLDLEFSGALTYFPRTEEERTLINKTQLECSELILEILTPEDMTSPLPGEGPE